LEHGQEAFHNVIKRVLSTKEDAGMKEGEMRREGGRKEGRRKTHLHCFSSSFTFGIVPLFSPWALNRDRGLPQRKKEK
jgi:hypothetical protein